MTKTTKNVQVGLVLADGFSESKPPRISLRLWILVTIINCKLYFENTVYEKGFGSGTGS
jgi:hypothetical protein